MRLMALTATALLIALIHPGASLAEEPKPSAADPVEALENAVADAIARAEPSVVAIARVKADKGQETLAVRGRGVAPEPGPQDAQATRFGVVGGFVEDEEEPSFDYGSGVVIGPKGEILTAFHVVQGAARLTVRARGHAQFAAEIIAADPRSDLAVIAPKLLPRAQPLKLAPITLGDSSNLRKGAFLIALGNPYNAARDGSASASMGILSNLSRRMEQPNYDVNLKQNPRQLRHYASLLQLDAKLNLGTSGGAVINRKGELVGLTTAGANVEGYDGRAGYAIPIDALARRAIEALMQGKEVEYGFLGLSLGNLTIEGGRPDSGEARVAQTKPGSPADRAGIMAGDTIVSVGNRPVHDPDSLILAVNALPVGQAVTIKLKRVDPFSRTAQDLEKSLVLAKYPVEGEIIATTRPAAWRGLRIDHLSTTMGANLPFAADPDAAMLRGGVVVTEVQEGTPAEQAGLKKGQLIATVDGQPARNPSQFQALVADKKGPVKLDTDLGTVTIP